jgi:hypothetical protein
MKTRVEVVRQEPGADSGEHGRGEGRRACARHAGVDPELVGRDEEGGRRDHHDAGRQTVEPVDEVDSVDEHDHDEHGESGALGRRQDVGLLARQG